MGVRKSPAYKLCDLHAYDTFLKGGTGNSCQVAQRGVGIEAQGRQGRCLSYRFIPCCAGSNAEQITWLALFVK